MPVYIYDGDPLFDELLSKFKGRRRRVALHGLLWRKLRIDDETVFESVDVVIRTSSYRPREILDENGYYIPELRDHLGYE